MFKNTQKIFALGLMSGTSMDGINLSIVKTNGIYLDDLDINKIIPYSKKTLDALYNILKKLPKSLDNQELILETSKLVTCDHYQSIKSLLNETNIKPDIIGFHEYNSMHMEPLDGPAGIVMADGKWAVCILDRNGLRPSRFYVTKSDKVIMASEVGVLDVKPEDVVSKGRLQPGKMFLIDFEQGRMIPDEELKSEICNSKPYEKWVS